VGSLFSRIADSKTHLETVSADSGRVHRFCQGAMMKRQRVPGANESPARTTRGMVSIPSGHGADTVSTSRKTRMIPRREHGLVGRPRSTRSAAGARGACDVNRGRLTVTDGSKVPHHTRDTYVQYMMWVSVEIHRHGSSRVGSWAGGIHGSSSLVSILALAIDGSRRHVFPAFLSHLALNVIVTCRASITTVRHSGDILAAICL